MQVRCPVQVPAGPVREQGALEVPLQVPPPAVEQRFDLGRHSWRIWSPSRTGAQLYSSGQASQESEQSR